MKLAKFLKSAFVFGVVTACACGLAACVGGSGSSGVAATVNGTDISEDEITQTIETMRAQYGLEEEDAWGQYLVAIGSTPQSIREQLIDSKVDQILAKDGAAELGITVDSAEVDSNIESMKANFEDDEAWQKALKQADFTEESYRENIEQNLLTQAIQKHFNDEAKASKDDILDTAKQYASYYDGAKKSSHILVRVEDVNDKKAMKQAREKVQGIIDRINNGETSFEDAAKENSDDTASAEDGGNVGWDKLSSFVTEYTDALDKLGKDEMSGPVDTQYGVHVIKCTDVFTAPEEVKSVKDFPKEFRESIKSAAKSTKASEDYDAWVDSLKESANIVINDMPEKVSYNIDLTKYQEESDESADDESSDEGDGEEIEVVEDDGAEIEVEGEDAASDDAASSDAEKSGE